MRPIRLLALIALTGPTSVSAASDHSAILASWNIRHLGYENGKDFVALGVIGSHFDFISVQEVMSETGIVAFRDALERETSTSWDHLCSDYIGRGTYREMYCFVWRDQKITWIDGAVVYLDDRDVFAREPFSARFQTKTGFQFVATSIHSIYGDNVAEREKEARALREYRDWLTLNFSPTPIFLMGDFNLAPTNPAWRPLGEIMLPLIREGATTISTIDGRFANLYDNIWVEAGRALPVKDYGRLEFPHAVLGISHEQARDRVSDHIPVWVEIDTRLEGTVFPRHSVPAAAFGSVERQQPRADQPRTEQPQAAAIIGNRNSNTYLLPGCASYGRVSAANQVLFSSQEEARSRGFLIAKNC